MLLLILSNLIYQVITIIPITKNNAILPMRLQLLSNNNDSVMLNTIIGIKQGYLISLNPIPYSLLPTLYCQGNVARLLINGIRHLNR